MTGGNATLEGTCEAVEAADQAVLLCDATGTVRAVSDSCGVVFECDTGAIVGETVGDLVQAGFLVGSFPDEYEAAVGRLRGGGNGRGPTDSESLWVGIYPGPSDECLRYDVTLTPVTDADGLVGVRWDLVAVGTRERYEETLEALHRATRDLVGAESELAVYDRIGAAANDILEMPGTGVRAYDPDEEVLRHVAFGNPETVIDSRPPYDVDDSPHGRAFRKGEVVVEEIDQPDPFDREVFTHVMYVPIGEYGVLSLGRVGGPFADTDRRFAEILAENGVTAIQEVRQREQLQQQRRDLEQYETIVETVPDPVYATDADGHVTIGNEAFREYFGVESEDRPLNATDLAHGTYAETLADWLDAAAEDPAAADPLAIEVDTRGQADRRRQFEAAIAPLPAEDDSFGGAAGVFRDVTDRKRRQEVLTVMNRALRHNLRTTASTITVYANIIGEDLPPERQEYVDSIESATNWLVKLGDTLRTLQTVLTESRGETVTIERLLSRTVSQFRAEYPAVELSRSDTPSGRLPGGPALQCAIENVVENAIVHNDSESPCVAVTVETTTADWVDIHVADNGPGIPETERAIVQGEAEITQLQHGSGIGLWVTRWIVEAFEGDIRLAANEPRGSVVTLSLPLLEES